MATTTKRIALDPTVQKYVRRTLLKNPKAKLADVKAVATRMNPRIGKLSMPQFHGSYSLPVIREMNGTTGPIPHNGNGHKNGNGHHPKAAKKTKVPTAKADFREGGRVLRAAEKIAKEASEQVLIVDAALPPVVEVEKVAVENPRMAAAREAEQLEERFIKVRGIFRRFAYRGLNVVTADEARTYLASIDDVIAETLKALDAPVSALHRFSESA